jgi:hypothetical protein
LLLRVGVLGVGIRLRVLGLRIKRRVIVWRLRRLSSEGAQGDEVKDEREQEEEGQGRVSRMMTTRNGWIHISLSEKLYL